MQVNSVVMAETVCPSAQATIEAGRQVGQRLGPGDVVLLSGELGAGKTTLAQGIVEGYGMDVPVTSPSFALIHEYRQGSRLVVHFDPYRLEDPASLHDIGWEEYLDGHAVMLIEWPERLADRTPSRHILVTVEALDSGTRRLTLSVAPSDWPRWENLWAL